MEYALVLYFDNVPEIIEKLKTVYCKNDICPPHVVLAKVDGDYEKEIMNIFAKRRNFKLLFDKVMLRDGIIAVCPSNICKIEDLIGTLKFQEYILDVPDKFYMTIGNKTGKDMESTIIDKAIIPKLKMPFEIQVEGLGIIKMDKSVRKKHRKWVESGKITLN